MNWLVEIAAEVAAERGSKQDVADCGGLDLEGMRAHMYAWLTVDRAAFLRLEERKMVAWSRIYA